MNIEDMVLSLMRRAARGVFRAMPTPIQSVVKRVNLAGQRLYLRLRPPRRIAPTRAGLLALFAPLVLGIAAINAANNLLFLLLGACLGAIVLSGILSERAIRGVQAHISPVGDIRAGAPTRLLVRLERTQYSQDDPAEFGLRVRESASREARLREEALDVTLPVIDGRAARAMTTRTFPRRGRAHLETCELVTTSPFGR